MRAIGYRWLAGSAQAPDIAVECHRRISSLNPPRADGPRPACHRVNESHSGHGRSGLEDLDSARVHPNPSDKGSDK